MDIAIISNFPTSQDATVFASKRYYKTTVNIDQLRRQLCCFANGVDTINVLRVVKFK